MRTILFFFLLILMSISVWAQDTDFPNRAISVKILNQKGRPINKIIVQSLLTGKAGITDHSGLFVFEDMSDNDTISVLLPKYGRTNIPVEDMDSIVVTVRSRNLYSYIDNSGILVMIEKNTSEPTSIIDVQTQLNQRSYNSLIDLLREHVTGLNITPNGAGSVTANIRGQSSFMLSSEPLVVLDGLPAGTINDVNTFLNVNEIKTIEVLKSAAEWGVRGANGVVLIKTH